MSCQNFKKNQKLIEHVFFKIIVIIFNFDALKQEFILNAFQKPPGHLKRISKK